MPERKSNMNNEIFYVLVDDHIVTRQEVEMAFYVTHGYHNTHKHEQEFLRWLYSLLGKTIKQAILEYDMQVEKLAQCRPILAMKLYRERYDGTLADARDYVENLQNRS
jgi:glycine/serine hydroxymethyltransferase